MGASSQVVQQAYEAFGRGDSPAVIGLLDEGDEWSAPGTLPHGGSFKGRDEVGRFFAGLGAAWEGLDLVVEAVGEVGGALVVGILRADGTRRGGGPSGYGAVHVFDVRDGRIVRFREYTDLDAPLG